MTGRWSTISVGFFPANSTQTRRIYFHNFWCQNSSLLLTLKFSNLWILILYNWNNSRFQAIRRITQWTRFWCLICVARSEDDMSVAAAQNRRATAVWHYGRNFRILSKNYDAFLPHKNQQLSDSNIYTLYNIVSYHFQPKNGYYCRTESYFAYYEEEMA